MQRLSIAVLKVCLLSALALAIPVFGGSGQDRQQSVTEVRKWRAADGDFLPFESEEDVLSFLSEAEFIATKKLTSGSNRPLKIHLRRGDLEVNAIFRVVDIHSKRAKLDGKLVIDFHDSYIFECAAYEFSRLLDIDNVPPCVTRRFQGKAGTLQLWVEGAQTEKRRRDVDHDLPNVLNWLREKQTMRIFDALISNFDRNQGNMLTDQQGKLWFIDHTRSFRKSALIERIDKIVWCRRDLLEKMKLLTKKQLMKRLSPHLRPLQISMILKRRDRLVEYLENRVNALGESAVLYDAGGVGSVRDLELEKMEQDEIPAESSMLVLQENN